MKILSKSLLIAATLVSLGHQAHAAESQQPVRFTGDTQFAGFCKAVVLDDVAVLRSSIHRSVGQVAASDRGVVRMALAEDGLTCNGTSLLEFSKQRNATEVHNFLMAQH